MEEAVRPVVEVLAMSEPSYTECGRVVVDANEWDRLVRLEKRVRALEKEILSITFTDSETYVAWIDVTKELK